ncbi:uncharacterized protein LOC111678423 [Lucilia cuprina]|uniref:uncharacterized protein LOC111678423 n=1 Tax=Lucilia cuprina TaxID=7375 RepID=UPI001F0541DB|nr:uncharacterized protein LOC111678423 [Lucilia cuprina]
MFFFSFLLPVNAIRCHQCNSHINEDCTTLRLSTPRAPRDDQFLAECAEQPGGARAFCRKTVLTIEVTGEHRIIRGCGWLQDRGEMSNNSCFTADNEGYKQILCACNEDGCNGSSGLHINKWSVLSMTALSVIMALVLRRN